jgi:hypothetical protein
MNDQTPEIRHQFETAILKMANLLGDYRMDIWPDQVFTRIVIDPELEKFFKKWFGDSVFSIADNTGNFFNSVRTYGEPFLKDLAVLVSFDEPFTLVGSDGRVLNIKNFSKLMKKVFLSHPEYAGRVLLAEKDPV